MAENALFVIHPYKHQGTWVFDDESVGLVKEPFVSGIPEIIEEIVQDLKDPEKGFRAIFSASPFPGYDLHLVQTREEFGGNWYRWEKGDKEGWLCPALFKYFKSAPKELYVKVESL